MVYGSYVYCYYTVAACQKIAVTGQIEQFTVINLYFQIGATTYKTI